MLKKISQVNTSRSKLSGREIEALVFEKGAKCLRECVVDDQTVSDSEWGDALKFNQRIWDILNADWQDPKSLLPKDIRQDLLSLSIFVRKTTLDLLAEPQIDKLNVLIRINENLAEGLRTTKES